MGIHKQNNQLSVPHPQTQIYKYNKQNNQFSVSLLHKHKCWNTISKTISSLFLIHTHKHRNMRIAILDHTHKRRSTMSKTISTFCSSSTNINVGKQLVKQSALYSSSTNTNVGIHKGNTISSLFLTHKQNVGIQ